MTIKYKIVKNPNCKHVIDLNDALNKLKQNNRDKWIEKYNINKDDSDYILNKHTDLDLKRTRNNLIEYDIVKDMSESDREKMYTNVYRKPIDPVPDVHSPLCDIEYRHYSKSLYKTAKKKEDILMKGLYGKRNKYELSANYVDNVPNKKEKLIDLIIDNFVFP
jgi:hypothetical protein